MAVYGAGTRTPMRTSPLSRATNSVARPQRVQANQYTLSGFIPDSILSITNLTGPVSNIQDDPESPDANWLTAT